MADVMFAEPRLADIYDAVEFDRSDLDAYVALVEEFNARSLLDLGCGTGSFACLLARRAKSVIGVDPAAASIAVARRKPYANRVRWLVGDARSLAPLQVDLVIMTGNVAQVFLSDEDWTSTLRAVRSALRPGGLLIFEVRDPAKEAWLEWTREQSYRCLELPQVGRVRNWVEVIGLHLPFVSFRSNYVFDADGVTLTSNSTLRFRTREEITASLQADGFAVDDIRDAPDRPGRELVFISRRGGTTSRSSA
jgi:SAM-dependent methyltransferase